MTLRLHVDTPLADHAELALPEAAARHVQVRRLQPGDALVLFDGSGAQWAAEVVAMGRREVSVRLGAACPGTAEPPAHFALALGMPANERMDALVEKATELGVAAIHPLVTERSVLRLAGERAERRVAHWQSVAVSAAEQCGRTRVPQVAPVATLEAWLAVPPPAAPAAGGGFAAPGRLVMSTGGAPPLAEAVAHVRAGTTPPPTRWIALSGPEGGLTPAEERAAQACGFIAASLGPRILRADTAPLAWLAQMALLA